MRNPFAAFSAARRLAVRLGAIGAAVLLVVLIGGMVVGLILVRRGGTSTSSPAIAPMSVYAGSGDGSVYKLDARTGTLIWHTQIGSQMSGVEVIAAPVVLNGAVYVSLVDGMGKSLVALNATNGSVRWRAQIDSKVASEAAVADGIVYVTGFDGNLYAFAASNGALRWRFHLGSFEVVAVDGGLVYASGRDENYASFLYALDASSGAPRWHVPAPDAHEGFGVLVAINGVVYTALTDETQGGYKAGENQGSSICAFNGRTGDLLWKSPALMGSIADAVPTWADGKLFIPMTDGSLVALNATTGAQLWSYKAAGDVGASPGASPRVVGQVVYFGYGNTTSQAAGGIVALNTGDGALRWQHSITGYMGMPFAAAAGMLYAGSSDGQIHALGAADGAQVWQYQYLHITQDVAYDPTVAVTAAP